MLDVETKADQPTDAFFASLIPSGALSRSSPNGVKTMLPTPCLASIKALRLGAEVLQEDLELRRHMAAHLVLQPVLVVAVLL